MDLLSIEICLQLREARRAKGLTQADLARRVGCQQSAVSMMEAGRSDALAQETLTRIASELGVVLETNTPELSTAPSSVPSVGRAFCTDPECPSNVPFVTSGTLLFWPRPQPVPGGRHCAFCGEVLAHVCGQCGAPSGTGACCKACGRAFVPPPATVQADSATWAENRRRQIAEWRALAQ